MPRALWYKEICTVLTVRSYLVLCFDSLNPDELFAGFERLHSQRSCSVVSSSLDHTDTEDEGEVREQWTFVVLLWQPDGIEDGAASHRLHQCDSSASTVVTGTVTSYLSETLESIQVLFWFLKATRFSILRWPCSYTLLRHLWQIRILTF